MSKVESLRSARLAFRLPRFILLRSFSDTLLVVSIVGGFAVLKGLKECVTAIALL